MNSVDFLLWLQDHRTPPGDVFFAAFSVIGDTVVYAVVLPILYWTTDRRFFIRVFLLMLAVGAFNTILKAAFDLHRPHEIDARIVSVWHRSETGLAFPSGHAQSASCFWFYVAWKLRRDWLTKWAAAMILLIGFSRLYLGSHWPADVLGGIAVGIATAALALALERVTATMTPNARRLTALALVVVAANALAFASIQLRISEGVQVSGALVGCVTTWLAFGQKLTDTSELARAAKVVGSIVGVSGIYGFYGQFRRSGSEFELLLLVGFVAGIWLVWAVPTIMRLLSQTARPTATT